MIAWLPRRMRALGSSALHLCVVCTVCAACSSSSGPDGGGSSKPPEGQHVRQQQVDKLDLLFAIDNSSSMADKQALLRDAIPDLVARLVAPNCVDPDGKPVGKAGPDGTCALGQPEFPPVHDMHVGIVSSSLGSRGESYCQPNSGAAPDDRGHLLDRGGQGGHVANAAGGHFLAWLPDVPENKGRPKPIVPVEPNQTQLVKDFSDLVVGAGQNGCAFEAQLESMYRFLVQPDPWDTAHHDPPHNPTRLEGVDLDILRQRHDFLRPDSAVAIIMLTDENDSGGDPQAAHGYAWDFETLNAMKGGTNACKTNPNDPDCRSCLEADVSGRPECASPLPSDKDFIGLRYFHMKQRFGVDVRFPIQRYIKGLREPRVPNRDGEHPSGSSEYAGEARCTNPLFAAELPDGGTSDPKKLCELPRGPRTSDLVFFAIIGGVPWQLLTDKPSDLSDSNDGAFKATLDDADWQRILGKDPLAYDFTGADPRMLESITPRAGIGAGEWDTDGKDLQYACTFPLAAPRDCTLPENDGACDCRLDSTGQPSKSPLCDPQKRTTQLRGKAYPTVSELAVVKALGPQGIVASICPRTMNKDDRYYGYKPAVSAVVDRLKGALAGTCLPKPLPTTAEGASCTLLVQLPSGDPATACDPAKGLSQPDPNDLQRYRERRKAEGEDDASLRLPVCAARQLHGSDLVNGSCKASNAAGWCYVTAPSDPASKCAQAIAFSASARPPSGALVELQCAPE